MIRSLLSLVLTLHLLPAYAQPEEHPIEQELGRCIARDDTTMGRLDCMRSAYARWDTELNVVYRELMANLSPAAAEQLRDSQRRWITFRDAEFAFLDQFYGSRQGTMWLLNRAGARLGLLRRRVQDLIDYRDMLNLE